MRANGDQIYSGLTKYIDSEVIGHLPTSGKWLVGAGMAILSNKAQNLAHILDDNEMLRKLEIVDDNGFYDIDILVNALKESANKYGKMVLTIPLIGNVSFSESDIDSLKRYIERG